MLHIARTGPYNGSKDKRRTHLFPQFSMEDIMKFLLLACLSLGGSFLTAYDATAECSIHDRVDLAKAGYSKTEINGMCEQDASSMTPPRTMQILSGEGQARWSQWCRTSQGSCPLNPVLGYYAVGAPCNCYMPWGFSAGVAQ